MCAKGLLANATDSHYIKDKAENTLQTERGVTARMGASLCSVSAVARDLQCVPGGQGSAVCLQWPGLCSVSPVTRALQCVPGGQECLLSHLHTPILPSMSCSSLPSCCLLTFFQAGHSFSSSFKC